MKKRKKQKTTQPSALAEKRRLYEALLFIYNFRCLEDLLFLKSERFLKLCSVSCIDLNLGAEPPNKSFLRHPFRLSCPLRGKTKNYGELIFLSSQKFSQSKKRFLKKIAAWTADTLHFIESKEKMESVKRQWGGAFNSFSQAFCITDKNLKIIRANKSFQEITGAKKNSLPSKSLPEICPHPLSFAKSAGKRGDMAGPRGKKRANSQLGNIF